MSTLLTLTTPPLELSDAIEYLLRPLKAVRFPVHEISLMLSIALRFVPTLMDETEKIMNAQRARGVDFGEGNLVQKMKAVIPLLIPLFVSSLIVQKILRQLWKQEAIKVVKDERNIVSFIGTTVTRTSFLHLYY